MNKVADAVVANKERLLEANALDLNRMDKSNPLYDRLMLTGARLDDMRNVASLPSPLGRVTKAKTLSNGMRLHRVSVPFGVIGRSVGAALAAGNACVLKGGKDADNSNREAVNVIHEVLRSEGIDECMVSLLPATHEATARLLNAVGYVDLCIPRGGRRLIDFVRDTARVPVIETGAGVVNTYFDEWGDVGMGAAIINNAKTRRVSVCNALDCLLIHEKRLPDLAQLCSLLAERNVVLLADEPSYAALDGKYPHELLRHSAAEDYGAEFMDYKLAVRTVSTIDEAIEHIARYGSGHSECIITGNEAAARKFQTLVDAACVYWNVPTSFTDGAQFGLGAEIGISTQKLGPRGPMAFEEITTYKWIVEGEGQIRK